MATNNTDNAAKQKALNQALEQIQKQYGKGAIINSATQVRLSASM
jgi:hypothetical protein